ncbi:microtubule-associated protein RP/EB family member 2 [Teleopsis dalmanni]|uniref:microtubule-associated protein RP/EB family member 2 n=1 Tax=Teleopsis dalmanni TaxID=139649 RepID=UPI0018CCDD63|nr:microtubule-associated protein RP/EB family member 2 [Teleopsis dalmanni]
MIDIDTIVDLASDGAKKMSQHELIAWINSVINGKYTEVVELSSGVAYCQIMDKLYPNCFGKRKINYDAKSEHEYLHNFKLFQSAFFRLNFDKKVPMEKLAKGDVQENLEFVRWFKAFHLIYSNGKENIRLPMAPTPPKEILMRRYIPSKNKQAAKTPDSVRRRINPAFYSPSHCKLLEKQRNILNTKINVIDYERDFYFRKLHFIEQLLQKAVRDNVDKTWNQHLLDIIYFPENFECDTAMM